MARHAPDPADPDEARVAALRDALRVYADVAQDSRDSDSEDDRELATRQVEAIGAMIRAATTE